MVGIPLTLVLLCASHVAAWYDTPPVHHNANAICQLPGVGASGVLMMPFIPRIMSIGPRPVSATHLYGRHDTPFKTYATWLHAGENGGS